MKCKKLVLYSCLFLLICMISCATKTPTQPETVERDYGVTDAQGQAPIVFNEIGHLILVIVTDESYQPLKDIKVEGWKKGSKYMIIAYDPSDNYFPNIKINKLNQEITAKLEVTLKQINMAIVPRDLREAVIELEASHDEILEFMVSIRTRCNDEEGLWFYYETQLSQFQNFLLVSAPLFTPIPMLYAVVPKVLNLGHLEKDFIHSFFPEGDAFKEFKSTPINNYIYMEPLGLCEPSITGFSAYPVEIKKGEYSTLRWTTFYATEVTIEPRIGIVERSGKIAVYPTETTTYTLKAKNLTKEKIRTTTVTVTDGG